MAFIALDHVSVDFPVLDARGRSLRAAMMSVGRSAGRRIDVAPRGHALVHALKAVSLRMEDGDRVGLIGGNGSGKSTLLRLLSGVYEPTEGTIHIQGGCCPLLDLTLGIDVDATGYENIRLRGLALGMSLKQIRETEREIAAFAELGEHLRLAVRTYSSGMLLRLAFAVSTSLPREIVVIDEVIGAGDASFMHKARERLHRLLRQSNILVIASHAGEVLRQMCSKGLYLREGEVVFFGPIDEALALYDREQ